MAVQVTDNLDLGGAARARWDYDPDRDSQVQLGYLDRRGPVPLLWRGLSLSVHKACW